MTKSSISFLLLISLLFSLTNSAAYTYSTCLATEFLNSANLSCTTCPTNQISNLYQTVATACQCQAGYRLPVDANVAACTAAFTTACATPLTSYYAIYNLDGSATTGTANCIACSSTAFPNA